MARFPRHLRAVFLPALVTALVLLAACAPQQAQQVTAAVVAPAVAEVQATVAQVVVPATLAVRETVQAVAAPVVVSPSSPGPRVQGWAGAPAAADLIVRWEVTSPAVYARKYQGVVCPGGVSGPTVGIGYDLGHQTAATIAADWAAHPDVDRLVAGSGQVGEAACAAYRRTNAGVRVSYAQAVAVFESSTLPAYHAAAQRALRAGWAVLPQGAQVADVSLGYNRGWSMRGDRNREKRAIRDTCAPAGDRACNATQLRAMCRLWEGTPNGKGLCARRHDEARVAVTL